MAIESHRDLDVWKKAMQFVDLVYTASRSFPKEELFGISSQLRRAAVSVPCNIAEGHARGTRKDYAGFVATAKGSLVEAETLLLIAVRQGYLELEAVQPLLALSHDLERMLSGLRTKLLASQSSVLAKQDGAKLKAFPEP